MVMAVDAPAARVIVFAVPLVADSPLIVVVAVNVATTDTDSAADDTDTAEYAVTDGLNVKPVSPVADNTTLDNIAYA